MVKEIDYRYSLELLKKINGLKKGEILLMNTFFYEGYNIWQMYQQHIFEDIKVFNEGQKTTRSVTQSFISVVKDIVVGGLIFLISIAEYIITVISRKEVLVYAVDRTNSSFKSDFRIEELYKVLYNNKVNYTEIFHTILSRDTLIRFLNRRRSSFYLEVSDWLFSILVFLRLEREVDTRFIDDLDMSDFSTDEQKFVRLIIEKYVRKIKRSIFSIKLLTKILTSTKIKVLFALDDARSYNELILACKLSGITTYALQHGHFTKYHVGWLVDSSVVIGNVSSPDFILVWSSYWKKELIRLGGIFDPGQIIIGGVKVKINFENKGQSDNVKNKNINILIPYETACPKSEVAEYINKLLDCPNVHVFFKLRPDISQEIQLKEYELEKTFNERFEVISDIKECIKKVDIVAGVYSTFLYDMIAYDKRVVILDTSSDYGEGMIINSLADRLSSKGAICKRLDEIVDIPNAEIDKRKKRLYGIESKYLHETLESFLIKEKIV